MPVTGGESELADEEMDTDLDGGVLFNVLLWNSDRCSKFGFF